jgi:transcription elongation GreA/GreB family factor
MDKKEIIELLLEKLKKDREELKRLIKDLTERRNDAPTRNEARYDSTRAELQYSLNAYNKKLDELEKAISDVEFLKSNIKKSDKVDIGSLVFLENGLNLLVLSSCGGETIKINDIEINVITQKSPIYNIIRGKKENDIVILLNGERVKIKEVR